MKRAFIIIIVLSNTFSVQAQRVLPSDSNVTNEDLIYLNKINGFDVSSKEFNLLISKKLDNNKKIIYDYENSSIYLMNSSNTKYIRIWSAPDIGYSSFYSIGYAESSECKKCGLYIGKTNDKDFVVNNDIKLGDDIQRVWPKAHLNYFRKFTFDHIDYYYYEQGIKTEIPFTPSKIFFYKFRDGKLIEIGFGNGMMGINPMF